MKTFYLYGIAGASDAYRVLRYEAIEDDGDLRLDDIWYEATCMKARNPSIESVYAIGQRRGLARDYRDAWTRNTTESFAIFRDILEREGHKII